MNMNATWLIAKYMDDLRRREPRNVGVILISDRGSLSKFKGEKTDGEIDGRRINVGSGDNYKAWVAHWKRTLREGGERMRLLGTGAQGNYFLEFGGERLMGNADVDDKAFLDELYRELVEDLPIAVEAPDPRRLIERTFVRLKIKDRITNQPALTGHAFGVDDHLVFDYRYRNGINVLMKRVHIANETWDHVHEAAWNFTQARTIEPDTRLVPLISHATGVDPSGPLSLLQRVGVHQTVDVSDEDRAVGGLTTALGLSRS
jgi:hypothetical protein